MRRLLQFVLLPLLVCGQSVQEQEVAARFEAGTAPDLAWAANLAAKYGLREYVPQIEALLTHADPLVRAQALDALIKLKVGTTPITMLAPLAETNFDAAMVLLARQPTNARPLLLEWSQRTLDNHQWWVIHSLLAATKASGQAGVLLRNWTYRAEERVLDGPGPPPLEPSWILFGLPWGSEPATQVVAGPHPVWLVGACMMPALIDRSSFTLDYLRHLGNTIPAPTLEIQFRSVAQFERDLARLQREMREFIPVLRGSLIASGALEEKDWVEPKIEWSLVDRRQDRSVPLPPLR